MTPHAPPAEAGPADDSREMMIMQAILGNCAALGVAPDDAKRMAIRSILNLRRVKKAV
ncbi:hypothetical protein GIY56_14285 [Paracoccus sp. YIM 132242]|uniref:Uncharacterized protein n=1 Tax=Paracoccus lichenicola TaxID=2665644 RepID=A0A6L6HT79_9RHOB|nr:hypothetical protein [Paracoccus lichenicola]MTE01453.1 hypothetical protein [Paracoccus lichenicola]